MAKVDVLREMIEPTVTALGYTLWGIEYQGQGKYSLLRLFIDAPNGVTVDDCSVVSHHVSGVLDVEDPIDGEYTLEVSSPGMDRPLYTLEQYQAYVGHVIDLRLRVPFEGRRKFKGVLNAIEGDEIVIHVDDHEYLLPISTIEKANIVPTF
ncbi:MAG: ribosome maturation factor RimP [Pseudomonadota bacterium]